MSHIKVDKIERGMGKKREGVTFLCSDCVAEQLVFLDDAGETGEDGGETDGREDARDGG